jgi:hypothetical protein
VMAWIQKHRAAREREAVRVTVAVLLEVMERVEPERPVLGEAVVVGWSVATLGREGRPRQAASARSAAGVAQAQARREAESGNMLRQTRRAVLEEREEPAEDT